MKHEQKIKLARKMLPKNPVKGTGLFNSKGWLGRLHVRQVKEAKK